MERDCNNCVYSTRDGGCRKWSCEGTKTVKDIRKETIEEVEEKLRSAKFFFEEDLDRNETVQKVVELVLGMLEQIARNE